MKGALALSLALAALLAAVEPGAAAPWLETEWDTKAKASYGTAQDRADQTARMR